MYRDFCVHLRAKAEARARELSDQLGRGGAGDYGAYREQVGRIKGMSDVVELAFELLKLTAEDDDRDEP